MSDLTEGRSEMTRKEDSRALVHDAEEVASKWEEAIHLNGAGARAIRELTNFIRNFDAAGSAMDLITEQYEKLIVKQDKLLQANLVLQREMIALMRRVTRLEGNGN
jgi:uncharacterized protein YjcR